MTFRELGDTPFNTVQLRG